MDFIRLILVTFISTTAFADGSAPLTADERAYINERSGQIVEKQTQHFSVVIAKALEEKVVETARREVTAELSWRMNPHLGRQRHRRVVL